MYVILIKILQIETQQALLVGVGVNSKTTHEHLNGNIKIKIFSNGCILIYKA